MDLDDFDGANDKSCRRVLQLLKKHHVVLVSLVAVLTVGSVLSVSNQSEMNRTNAKLQQLEAEITTLKAQQPVRNAPPIHEWSPPDPAAVAHLQWPAKGPYWNVDIQLAQLYDPMLPKESRLKPCKRLVSVGLPSEPKSFCIDVPPPVDCVVYDIGVQNEDKFPRAMADLYGCKVFSYDPTIDIDKEDWAVRTNGGSFYKIGIGAQDGMDPDVGQLQTLSTMMISNGHSRVEFFKIDVEGFEWEALEQIVADGTIEKISHILIEIHFWNGNCKRHWIEWESKWSPKGYPWDICGETRACAAPHDPLSAATSKDIERWRAVMQSLYDSGFSLVFAEYSGGGQEVEFPELGRKSCCAELSLTRHTN